MKQIYVPLIVFIVLILLCEIIIFITNTPPYLFPAPSKVLLTLHSDFRVLFEHSLITFLETIAGIIIATFMAMLLSILMDGFKYFYLAFYPILIVTQTIPIIVLTPIFIIYLGFGFMPKVVVVSLVCFFPIVINFIDGMKNIDDKKINLARLFGARGFKIYRIVKIPAALPSLFSGLKVAGTYSITGAVVGEWMSSNSGLGYYMLRAKNGFMLDKVFACIVVIIMLSLLMNIIIYVARRIIIPEHR